ncbi:MAG TPA: Ger(x)C family spore germination C-terminal domain-containing protein, partial [Pseudobacillus sp.]
PFLPIIKQAHDHIRYMGLALFKDEKYVGRLSFRDGYIFKMLHENFERGIYEIEYKGAYIAIENLHSKVKYKVSGTKEKPIVSIHVSLKGKVQEGYGMTLHTEEKVRMVEKEWAKETTKRATKVINKLQKLQSDSLGIGEKVASHFRRFDQSSWKELYPDTPIHVKIETNIINTGIVE